MLQLLHSLENRKTWYILKSVLLLKILLLAGALEIQAQNYALNFDGINSYVEANSVSTALNGTDELSLEVWINRADNLTESKFVLTFHWPDAENQENVMLLGVSKVGLLALNYNENNGNGNIDRFGTTAIPANQWTHIALTIAADNSAVAYINGEQELTWTILTRPVTNGYFSIGQDFDGLNVTNDFIGNIDEVRIWNTARTPDEIRENMYNELAGSETGLVAYYNMTNGSGTSLSDNSSNSNTGTLINNVTWVSDFRVPAGDGTAGNPYQIATLENLYWLSQNESVWGANFIQTEDIDASATATWDDGKGWIPIGDQDGAGYFYGQYNGQSHTISGLTINRPGLWQTGFFGFIAHTANISNVGLIDVDITGGYGTGALIGQNGGDNVEISNCFSTGTVKSDKGEVGGLIGGSRGKISNCYSTCAVSLINPASTLRSVGGFIGAYTINNSLQFIKNCYASGNASGYDWVGGFVGHLDVRTGGTGGQISDCYATGDVNGNRDVGGFGGYGINQTSTDIVRCYSIGKINGTGSSNVNSFFGYCGVTYESNSFWDINTDGVVENASGSTNYGVVGKTTPEMKTQNTFTDAGWNFSSVWKIDPAYNSGYPYFQWQVILPNAELTTSNVSNITNSSATLGGNVTNDNGIAVLSKGVVWSTTERPTIDSYSGIKSNGSGTGSFTCDITGLAYTTKYYVRAYATNSSGTSYGEEKIFTTKQTQSITFNALADKTYGDSNFDPEATATSGLTVSYSSSNISVANIVDGKIHIVGVGSCTIYADQAGDDTYDAASQVSQTLTVNKKALTITSATASGKDYDGNTDATISGATLSGVVGSDDVALGNATTGTFAQATIGTGISVGTAMTIGGTDADNYTLTQPTLTADITAKELTVTNAVAANKVYDGNTDATISGATLSGVVGSDDVALGNATTGTFAQATIGTGISVGTAMTIGGTDADNYTLTQPTLTADITAKELTVTNAVAANKVYDGNTDATISGATLSGVVSGDDVTLGNAIDGTFAQASVGTNIAVATAMTIGGADAGNYSLTQPVLTADITPKALTVEADNPTKTYDGTVYSPFTVSYSGFSTGENETVLDGTLSFNGTAITATNVGTAYGISPSGLISSNYDITFVDGTLDITPKELTVSAAVASDKVYDGQADAVISGAILSGVVGSDEVLLDNHTTGVFSQSGAGTNIAVSTSMTISGADAGNYSLTQPALTANITKKALTVTAEDQTKTYDGAVYSPFTVVYSGFVEGEGENDLTGALTFTGSAATATDVGKAYVITPEGLSSSNYEISFVDGELEIYPKTLTVTADDQSKAYDGAVFSSFTVSFSGFATGEDQDDLGGVPTFSGTATSATDVGEDYTIIPGGLSSWNYSINYVSGMLEITTKELQVLNATASDKVYDGQTDAVISGAILSGVAGSEDVSLGNHTTGIFAQAGAGTTIAVTTSMTISGADAGNYTLAQPALTGNITKKDLSVTAEDQSKIYDGAVYSPFTATYSGFITGEDESNLGGALTFSGSAATATNVGTAYVITPEGLSSSNYDITYVDGKLDITPMELTVTADAGQTKIYGEADPVFTYSVAPALVTGDIFSGELSRATGEDVGLYAIAQGTLTAGGNYDLSFVSSDFSITQMPITVTADAGKTKVYGEADPTFTYAVAPALVTGDSFSGELSRAAGDDVGLYAIAQGTLTAGANYDLSFVSSDFSITQKLITVTADAGQTKMYGEADPTFTYVVVPALESGDSFSGELSRTAGEDVGLYVIDQGTLTAGNNYDLSFVSSDFSIIQKPITVTADAGQTKIYGEADPTFTYAVTPALVTGDSFSGELSRATGEDVGLYAIAQGTLTAGANYDLSFVSSDFSITQKPIMVTADAGQTKIYGEADPTFTYAVTPALVTGDSFSGELSRTAGDDVGLYTIAQGTLTAGANYDLSFVSSDFSITQKPIMVTADAGQTKVYGEADPVFTYSVAPALVSGDNFSGELTRATGEDVGLYAIAQGTLTAGANYDLSFVSSDFSITKKPITVTADAGQTKVYGEADPAFSYVVSPALESGDSFSGELSRTAGEDIGSYAIAQGTLTAGDNYDLSFVSSDFSISQKPITVTADAGQTKVYGEADPVFTYSVAPALVTGDNFLGELSRTIGEDVGLYAIDQGTLTAGANYDLSFVSSDFSITQKPITVTADAGQTKIYGEADPVFTYSVAPALVSGDNFSGELTRATGEDVGLYAIAQGTLTAGANYDLSFVSSDFSITQKPITVTADAGQTKVYGEADPTFTYTFAPALVGGDSFSGELTRVAGEDVGDYAIAQGTLTAGANYDLSFVSSDFSITQKAITVTADAGQTKIYGEADPVFTYTFAPALIGSDSFSGELSRAAGEDVGDYAIAQGTLTAGSNYDLSFVSSDFSITQKAITVTADAGQTKVYGEADPVFTYAVVPALVGGDSFSGELSRATGEDVGLYAIVQGTLTAGANYDLSFVGNDFNITQKSITVTADAGQTKVYGEADPALTYAVVPALVAGDNLSGELSRTAGEDVGDYAIAQGTLTASTNYDLSYVGNDFNITQKLITVTPDAGQSKIYGEADPAVFNYSVAPALEDGDSFSGQLSRMAGENAGSYAITQGTLTASSNYELSLASETFTIEPKSQSISFNAIPAKHLETDADFMLTATASSGLPVSYTYTFTAAEAPATVSEDGFVSLMTSGEVVISASQAGNENYSPATPATQQLIITSSDGSIHMLTIAGEDFANPEQDFYYRMDCDNQEPSIAISYRADPNASSSEANPLVIATPARGIYTQSVTITSQDGTQQQTYHITIEKRFDFDEIIEQKYNNVLLVNNNPATNGGYRFVTFKWYKNGQLIGTGQYYSAGQNASDVLDRNASYSAELITDEGEVIEVCNFNIDLDETFTLTASPNPVRAGSTIEVATNYSDNMLSDRTVQITSLNGAPVMRQVSASNNSTITLPNSMAPGTYVVTTVASGVILTTKIIVQ